MKKFINIHRPDDNVLIHFDKGKEVTLTGNLTYINKPLLYILAFTRFDKDDFEYNYDLFELARFHKLIDNLKNL